MIIKALDEKAIIIVVKLLTPDKEDLQHGNYSHWLDQIRAKKPTINSVIEAIISAKHSKKEDMSKDFTNSR